MSSRVFAFFVSFECISGHVLRLLATHHIIREREPDIFALNRVSALLDSGRSFTECRSACVVFYLVYIDGKLKLLLCSPVKKYDSEYGGVAALAALKCASPNHCSFVHQPVHLQY
jgi:hypothetical protein